MSTAVEIMLLHLENLKRSYEREHAELEETRRVLVKHKLIGIGFESPQAHSGGGGGARIATSSYAARKRPIAHFYFSFLRE